MVFCTFFFLDLPSTEQQDLLQLQKSELNLPLKSKVVSRDSNIKSPATASNSYESCLGPELESNEDQKTSSITGSSQVMVLNTGATHPIVTTTTDLSRYTTLTIRTSIPLYLILLF